MSMHVCLCAYVHLHVSMYIYIYVYIYIHIYIHICVYMNRYIDIWPLFRYVYISEFPPAPNILMLMVMHVVICVNCNKRKQRPPPPNFRPNHDPHGKTNKFLLKDQSPKLKNYKSCPQRACSNFLQFALCEALKQKITIKAIPSYSPKTMNLL